MQALGAEKADVRRADLGITVILNNIGWKWMDKWS